MILSSSEHEFPFKLDRIGFGNNNFTGIVFAGEVPPADMFVLLTTRWGIGEHLATTFLNFYGGHVFDAYQAVFMLNVQKTYYNQESPWATSLHLNALPSCLALVGGSDAERAEMKRVLKALATSGFSLTSLTSYVDKVAEMITSKHVGGVVTNRAVVVGLPPTQLKSCLVPSKQSMRLMIADFFVT